MAVGTLPGLNVFVSPKEAGLGSRQSFRRTLDITLWPAVIVLTAVLIAWPVQPFPENTAPVQSVATIPHLVIFGSLFMVWSAGIAILAFAAGSSVTRGLFVTLVFCLVFAGFWVYASPWGDGDDTLLQMAMVLKIQSMGHMPIGPQSNLIYFDYPLLALAVTALSDVTTLNVFSATQVFLLVSDLGFVALVYFCYVQAFQRPNVAAIAAIVSLAASKTTVVVLQYLHPSNTSMLYIALFLFLVTRSRNALILGRSERIAYGLLTVVSSMEYMFTPVLFACTCIGRALVASVGRQRPPALLGAVVLPMISLVAWQFFQGYTLVKVAGSFAVLILHPLFLLDASLGGIGRIFLSNTGPRKPLWSTVSLLFWWTLVLVFGGALALREAFRQERRLEGGVWLTSGYVGLLVTAAIGAVALSGDVGIVHAAVDRYIWLGPLFTAPMVVLFFWRPEMKRLGFALAVAGTALIFPTFLAYADRTARDHTYRYELAVTNVLHQSYGNGAALTLYSFDGAPRYVFLALDAVRIVTIDNLTNNGITSANQLRSTIAQTAREFLTASPPNSLFLIWPKERYIYTQWIPVRDGAWSSAQQDVDAHADRVYDAGEAALYALPVH